MIDQIDANIYLLEIPYYSVPKKPEDENIRVVYTRWDETENFSCPLCESHLEYAYNDGGRWVYGLEENKVWVISNYYRCLNSDCDLHRAFPALFDNMIPKKKYGKDVWERIAELHSDVHLNNTQIRKVLWSFSKVSITEPTIGSVIKHFEGSIDLYLTEEVKKALAENGYIVLSLDGAQPKKGRPALWIFSDRLTGHVLLSVILRSAAAPILVEKLKEIESTYGFPIKSVISDKQKNIVNAVKEFNPKIPHGFCHYHFLSHILEPIEAKSSHLATQLGEAVNSFSKIQNLPLGIINEDNPSFNKLYADFAPLSKILLKAIHVSCPKYKDYKGKMVYENLEFIKNHLSKISLAGLSRKYVSSFNVVIKKIESLLEEYKDLYKEMCALIIDSQELRDILKETDDSKDEIKKKVGNWINKLKDRLKKENQEFRTDKLKHVQMNYKTNWIVSYQQWIRLEKSYSEGLYHCYDIPDIERTNNPMEQLINQVKRHFKQILGKEDIQSMFERHGELYSRMVSSDLSPDKIKEILWKHSVAYIEGYMDSLSAFQPIPRNKWRITDTDTGLWKQFKENLESNKKK